MLQDIQFAVRGVLRAPGLSLGIIVVLAAGIGATTAMVSVLDALMYRPLASLILTRSSPLRLSTPKAGDG